MSAAAFKTVTLLRQIAFMVVVYLCLGWFVERKVQRPDSKVKAFFRVLCSPVTRPIARLLAPGTGYGRVLAVSIGVAAGLWVVLIALTEVLRRA